MRTAGGVDMAMDASHAQQTQQASFNDSEDENVDYLVNKDLPPDPLEHRRQKSDSTPTPKDSLDRGTLNVWRRKAGSSKQSLDRFRGAQYDSKESLASPPPQRTVRDPLIAFDFEKLLLSNETKKMTSTPDQMKNIEVRKGQQPKLEAKSAVAESDAALLKFFRKEVEEALEKSTDGATAAPSTSSSVKESHWVEFLKYTGPDDAFTTIRQKQAKSRPGLPQQQQQQAKLSSQPGQTAKATQSHLDPTSIRFPPSPPRSTRSSNDTYPRGSFSDLRMRDVGLNTITEGALGTSPIRARALSIPSVPSSPNASNHFVKSRSTSQISKESFGIDFDSFITDPRAPLSEMNLDLDKDALVEKEESTPLRMRREETLSTLATPRLPAPALDLTDSEDDELEMLYAPKKKVETGQSLAEFLRDNEPPPQPLRTATLPLPEKKDKKKRKTSALRLFSLGGKNKSASNPQITATASSPTTSPASTTILGRRISNSVAALPSATGSTSLTVPSPNAANITSAPVTPKTPKYTMIQIPYEATGSHPTLASQPPLATSSQSSLTATGRGSVATTGGRPRMPTSSSVVTSTSTDDEGIPPFRRATSHPGVWEGSAGSIPQDTFRQDVDEDVPPVPKVPAKYAADTPRSPSSLSMNRARSVQKKQTVMVDRAVETDKEESCQVGTMTEIEDLEEAVGLREDATLEDVLKGLVLLDPAFEELIDMGWIPEVTAAAAVLAKQAAETPESIPTENESSLVENDAAEPVILTSPPTPPSPPPSPSPYTTKTCPQTRDQSIQTIHDVLVAETIYISSSPPSSPSSDAPSLDPPSTGAFCPAYVCPTCETRDKTSIHAMCASILDDIVDGITGPCGVGIQVVDPRIEELERRLEVLARIAFRVVKGLSGRVGCVPKEDLGSLGALPSPPGSDDVVGVVM
ncbi:uncharacterized protein SPPG_08228 [Spizellomyces punctatus DAOM BR117]|uniref:Uncharacterized protein n=1 Tax=Spizellomyces punctatus (strain DAOM BR117) TaxID=645134 RepID=A0A0L0H522_SPIPD|nr:uncharacterized protein SPPG_08228 [Spizellomyces punctatus DAOM BR117]KNC96322.1 hypothetical protein SPPG_08228 [Spizellomyces punctatus DAOM BR117]|eukprot:XP_016604362.1 hypothetical protein SPPG_08228 [Spizellomyces punctatus DAOM BR117]